MVKVFNMHMSQEANQTLAYPRLCSLSVFMYQTRPFLNHSSIQRHREEGSFETGYPFSGIYLTNKEAKAVYYTVIKYDGHLRTRGKCRKLTFIECSQMTRVFYHSVIHGLGFFIFFKIQILHAQNNKTRFFYVLFNNQTTRPSFLRADSQRGAVELTIARIKRGRVV